jgi:RHS repeat-associated protein
VTVTRDVLADLLGSAVGVAEDGIVNADLTWFGDFGDTLSAPEWDTVTSFTGHVETAGLVEFATRTYDPTSRVWVQEDSFTGTITRASSLNRYAYVEGSPASHTDVLGPFRAAAAMAAQKLSAADYAAFIADLKLWAATPVCVAPGAQGTCGVDQDFRVTPGPEEYMAAGGDWSSSDLGRWWQGVGETRRHKWDMTVQWGSDVQSRRERTSWYENTRDALTLTQLTEVTAGLGAIWFDNGQYFDEGPLCGTEMECFVNTSFDYGTITLGHTINHHGPTISTERQVHEYGHVFDVEEGGAVIFYAGYGLNAVIYGATDWVTDGGEGWHDANPNEKTSEADEAAFYKDGTLPDQGYVSDFLDELLGG